MTAVRPKGRFGTYGTLVTIVCGMILAGLVVPFTLGDKVDEGRVGAVGSVGGGTALGGDGSSTTSTTTLETATSVLGSGSGPSGLGRGGSQPGLVGSTTTTTTRTGSRPTGDPITVAVLIADLGIFRSAGLYSGPSIEDQQKWSDVLLADLNARGGIAGRPVRAQYKSYTPANLDSETAACQFATRDVRAFAVLLNGPMDAGPLLCMSQQNSTPVLYFNGDSFPTSFYNQSKGNLFTLGASGGRVLGNQVYEAEALGLLRGKTIGIVSQDLPEDQESINNSLIPALKALGYEVAHHSKLNNNVGQAQSQIPLEIQQMQLNHVDTIFMEPTFLLGTTWAQQGDGQGFKPRYLVADFHLNSFDFAALRMPDSYAGAVAITSFRSNESRVGQVEPAYAGACRTLIERGANTRLVRDSGDYLLAQTYCAMFQLFERAAIGAGAGLTRASFSTAAQGLGEFEFGYTGGGSYRAGKLDYADFVRTLQWRSDCKCWMPTDAFRRARF